MEKYLKSSSHLSIFPKLLATVSLKIVSRKRRRKCTFMSYDRFTNKLNLQFTIKNDRKVKCGGRYS